MKVSDLIAKLQYAQNHYGDEMEAIVITGMPLRVVHLEIAEVVIRAVDAEVLPNTVALVSRRTL